MRPLSSCTRACRRQLPDLLCSRNATQRLLQPGPKRSSGALSLHGYINGFFVDTRALGLSRSQVTTRDAVSAERALLGVISLRDEALTSTSTVDNSSEAGRTRLVPEFLTGGLIKSDLQFIPNLQHSPCNLANP